MTARASKSPQSVARKKESSERFWCNTLRMWHLCVNTSCRRARCRRGNTFNCFEQNFRLLPEGVRDWFVGLGAAQAEGLLFDDMRAWLQAEGLEQEFTKWCAAVQEGVGAGQAASAHLPLEEEGKGGARGTS